MNWLAHLVLSESSPAFRVGNILTDILALGELRALPERFQPGVIRHRAIDKFTDSHPVYRRSLAQLPPPFRRYAGVIMDVFYDHALTLQWRNHSQLSVDEFVEQFHVDVEACRNDLPPIAYSIFQRMRAGRWLTSYGDLEGVRITLERISKRLKKPFDLGSATADLRIHYDALQLDFLEFFPQIETHFLRPSHEK